MPLVRCARNWQSSATCARATTTRPACRPARRGQRSGSSRRHFSARPKRFCGGEHARRRKLWLLHQNRRGESGKRPSLKPGGPGSRPRFCSTRAFTLYTWLLSRHRHFRGHSTTRYAVLAYLLLCWYSLRRRFVRGLPGMARAWLWMHTWLGVTALLIALLHENYAHILHDYCQNASCFTKSYWGTSALFALIFLILSGIIGRLLDSWQARVIAGDASANG